MAPCGRQPARSRRYFLGATAAAAVHLSGCVDNDPAEADTPVVEETIETAEEWSVDLAEGDRLRIVADDGSDTTLIGYSVEPPGSRGTSQRVVAVDHTIEAEESGEYVIRVDPSQETEVRIYRS